MQNMNNKILFVFLLAGMVALPSFAHPNRSTKVEIPSQNAYKNRQSIANKLEKRLQKIQKKLIRKGYLKEKMATDIWENDAFRMGALVTLGGLLLTILGALPLLGGIFTFIGVLMMVIGIALMIWALIEYY